MPRATRHLCHTLSELGWLFLRVQRYVKEGLDNPQLGRVAHALCAVLQEELAEYYRSAPSATDFNPKALWFLFFHARILFLVSSLSDETCGGE